jgi:hypothetical protein
MKRINLTTIKFFSGMFALVVFISCQKSTVSNGNPPPTDTTKHEKPDTAYLKKTQKFYTLGATIDQYLDSGFTTWTYDNQGRMLSEITFSQSYKDSTFYSYNGNQQVRKGGSASPGHYMSFESTETFFNNSAGKPDSTMSVTNTINIDGGNTTNDSTTNIVYYYYDANNNDTLVEGFSVQNNIKNQISKTRKTYVGSQLDSVIDYKASDLTTINSIAKYVDGDLISVYVNTGIGHSLVITNTFYDILAGGFTRYDNPPGKHLLKTQTESYDSAPPSFSSTATYTFDAANRVSTVLYSQDNNPPNEKFVYSYY